MITKIIDGESISVIAEESDDLLTLRRIIKAGDRIVGSTTRVLKQEKDFARPDKGRRTRIKIALNVNRISLDNVLDKLRIQGTIAESNNESVPHGSHHSMIVQANEGITITKRWSALEKRLLRSNSSQSGFILVAVDTTDCGIARLKGTHLRITPNMYSGASGKRYKTDFDIGRFFDGIAGAIAAVIKKGDSVIIFGPGQTRKRLANHLIKTKWDIRVVEGIDSGGEDGIYIFTKSEAMREIMAGSKLATVSGIIDEVMAMANKKSNKFTMGYAETRRANEIGAIDSLVFSEKIIQDADEQEVMDFLNDAEARGVRSFSVDSTTDAGLRVTGLGGMVAVLRFALS